MLERLFDRAPRVVVLVQQEARMLNHNYIGTEHILLGLIHEGDGIAAKSLESLGISLVAIRSQAVRPELKDSNAQLFFCATRVLSASKHIHPQPSVCPQAHARLSLL